MTMSQSWPCANRCRKALIRRAMLNRLYPCDPLPRRPVLLTTFFPMPKVAQAVFRGLLALGKTVFTKPYRPFSTVDIVVIVACGERQAKWSKHWTNTRKLLTPRTGGTLMDRTIIICNTSSMPGCCPRSVHLSGITLENIFGKWLPRSAYCRLHLHAGTGHARNFGSYGRNSRRRSLSCLSGFLG